MVVLKYKIILKSHTSTIYMKLLYRKNLGRTSIYLPQVIAKLKMITGALFKSYNIYI